MSLHQIAVLDADGNMRVIQANEIRVCAPTPKCIQFWATFLSCVIGIGVGLFLMVYQGTTSAYFNIGTGLLSIAFGTLLPGPKYKDVIAPTLRRSRPATPIRLTAPNNQNEGRERAVREHNDCETYL